MLIITKTLSVHYTFPEMLFDENSEKLAFLASAEYLTAQQTKLRIRFLPTSPKASSTKLWSAMPSCAKKRK